MFLEDRKDNSPITLLYNYFLDILSLNYRSVKQVISSSLIGFIVVLLR